MVATLQKGRSVKLLD